MSTITKKLLQVAAFSAVIMSATPVLAASVNTELDPSFSSTYGFDLSSNSPSQWDFLRQFFAPTPTPHKVVIKQSLLKGPAGCSKSGPTSFIRCDK